jgi:endonuclease IV
MDIQLGAHVNRDGKGKSITKYIKDAILDCSVHGLKMNTAAIFVSNPRGLQIILKDEELEELKEFIATKHFSVIAHSSYVAYLWNKDDPEKYIHFVMSEYNICKECGILGLVVHLPKESILKQKRIQSTIKKIIDEIRINHNGAEQDIHIKMWKKRQDPDIDISNHQSIIYLETPAITPMWASYDTPKKLSKLFYIIQKISKNHPFGLCIDTAHIWTSGNDISTFNGAKRWFTELMDAPYIPHDRIIIHLNDSAKELGHGPDKHAALTEGHIWGAYKRRGELKKSGLYFIIQFAEKYKIPIILERGEKSMLKTDYTILAKMSATHGSSPVK